MARCRLCTSNDDQALIEYLAEKLWDSRMGEFEIATPWAEARSGRPSFAKWLYRQSSRSGGEGGDTLPPSVNQLNGLLVGRDGKIRFSIESPVLWRPSGV